MKLAIFAGHGGSDPGAVYGNRQEKTYTLMLMLKVTEILRANGQTVINNRTSDVDSYITDKVAKANAENVDALIEIHLNAGGGIGSEVYYSLDGRSKPLAKYIYAELVALGFAGRGIKTKAMTYDARSDYFGVIRNSEAPAVLVECCFLDSDSDMALFNKFTTDKVAYAIAQGIMSTYGITDKREMPPEAPPEPKPPSPDIYEAGQQLKLANAPLYTSSDAVRAANIISGSSYYLYDGIEINGRYRITNAYSRVKATPVSSNVTGWVNKASMLIIDGTILPSPPSPFAAGALIALTNAPLYRSSTEAASAGLRTGTYYIYDGIEINGRYRITNDPSLVLKLPMASNVTGWIKKVNDPPAPEPEAPRIGMEVYLSKAPLYADSSTTRIANTLSGTFFLYDAIEINGRYRITNSKSNVQRTPIGLYVTGYISKSSIMVTAAR